VKQQRLCLAQDEYNHLNNALTTLGASRTSCECNLLKQENENVSFVSLSVVLIKIKTIKTCVSSLILLRWEHPMKVKLRDTVRSLLHRWLSYFRHFSHFRDFY